MKTKSFFLLTLMAILNFNTVQAQIAPTPSQTAQGGVGPTPGAAPIGTPSTTPTTQATYGSTSGGLPGGAGGTVGVTTPTNPGTGNIPYGGVNYDPNGYRTGPYYLDTTTTNSAATIGPLGGSASATGVPMGATPTTATGVPMGATTTTGTGGTIGVQTLSQWCATNPGADACR